ncbi:hypothetical protein E3J62_07435 [candidate division TA06 bacterium]|uniref:Type 4 fimbrial biogenesis protein PilX N-terminal domain-containing protein n=1 Tax=candidate division TA06 bacterium TaxID=2250710 RepID=A0A523USR2_UNCT6|nr:MAG: hypothetical protein E3J62_07435 [candidate division TA06 bacterium]
MLRLIFRCDRATFRTLLLNRESGTALIVSLMVTCLLMMLCFAFLLETNTETRFSSRQQAKSAAFYLAEAGAQRAYVRLCSDFTWRDGFKDEKMGSGLYTVQIDDSNSDPSIPEDIVRVTSTGKARNAQKIIRTQLKQARVRAFDYACFARDAAGLRFNGNSDPSICGGIYTLGILNVSTGCTVHGDLLALGDISIGFQSPGLSSTRLLGNINSGGTVALAPACSVLARGEMDICCEPASPAAGDVVARGAIYAGGFIEGEKRAYSDDEIDSVPFPENYFDFDWHSLETSSLRGWAIYRFEDSKEFWRFLRKNYSSATKTYSLGGIFLIRGDLKIERPKEDDRIILIGTLVASGDVIVSTPARFMLQRPDSTFPAIVSLGGDIVFEEGGGPVSILGLLYAKGEIHMHHTGQENQITLFGAECAYKIRNCVNSRVVYDPSVSWVMPFSPQPILLVQSWEEL